MKPARARPRLLMIAKTVPLHDRTGEGRRLFDRLRSLTPHLDIDFLAVNHALLNREEKVNKNHIYYAVRDGNFNRDRFEFVEEKYFADLEAIGVRPVNQRPHQALVPRPTNDFDIRSALAAKKYDLVCTQYFYLFDQYRDQIRRYQPWAATIIDAGSLHYRRLRRQGEYLERQVSFVVNAKHERIPFAESGAQPATDHYNYANRVREDELRVYGLADQVIVSNEIEKEILLQQNERLNITVLPPVGAAEGRSITRRPWAARSGIVYVGAFDHRPNVSAAIYLKHEVVPALPALIPGEAAVPPVFVVGSNPPYLVKTMARHGPHASAFRVTGAVPDVLPFLDRARVSVAPVLFDSGVNHKILEAMAAGTPVVTTSIGAEGLGLEPGRHCLVGDAPAAFASCVARLYREEALWQTIRANALAFVAERFATAADEQRVAAWLADFDFTAIAKAQRAASPRPRPAKGTAAQLPAPRFTKVTGKIDVSVILVTYNQWAVTEQCLRCLAHAQRAYPKTKIEVIVVDNASADGTPANLRRVPGLRVIANKKNLGFAKGNNVGLAAARGHEAVLLNNDTLVAPDWLERLRDHAAAIPDAGVIGPSTNTETHQALPGIAYNSLPEFYALNKRLGAEARGTWGPVAKISGLCFYLTRAALDRVGTLDEGFGLGYFEDDDYCLRVVDAGLKLVWAKDLYVHHYGSMSFEGASISREKHLAKGHARFIFKWGKRGLDHVNFIHGGDLRFAKSASRGLPMA